MTVPTTTKNGILAMHMARVPLHRALIRTLEHRLISGESIGRPCLDLGCGDGHFARLAIGPVDAGIDVPWTEVKQARRQGAYACVALADGTRLPYASKSFRTVVSNCVIEHIQDIDGLLDEVKRVLVDDGRFVFSVPSECFSGMLFTPALLMRLRLPRLAKRYEDWWNRRALHFHLDGPTIWEDRLTRHGLTVLRHTYYMSPSATRAFEVAHYLAVPSLIWHSLLGRWSVNPAGVERSPTLRWLLPFATEPWPRVGACLFFVARG